MENNTTFSNKESLNTRVPNLPTNDTFSNKVSLQDVLNIDSNSTFSNDFAVELAVSSQKVPDKKDPPKG